MCYNIPRQPSQQHQLNKHIMKLKKFILLVLAVAALVTAIFGFVGAYEVHITHKDPSSSVYQVPADAQMCKVVWKNKLTGFKGEGEWFPIRKKDAIIAIMLDAQSRLTETEHHVEYK